MFFVSHLSIQHFLSSKRRAFLKEDFGRRLCEESTIDQEPQTQKLHYALWPLVHPESSYKQIQYQAALPLFNRSLTEPSKIFLATLVCYRFTLRSRRGPHVSVGQGGVKSFRREIDRRLDYASHIKHEPKLCREGISETVPHHFRMLAVDKISELDSVIAR